MKAPIEVFEKLCTIPRGSGNEKGVADWLESFAAENGLGFYRDKEQNVLITRPGKGKGIVLQGHSDMVCEKIDGVEHDFLRDPIAIKEEVGHIIKAEGTTLGADDGISIAVMLAVLTDPSVTIPVECLITSQEEIGLLGMQAFDLSLIKGRMMINLDSMDEGIATVSCCGGVRTDIRIPSVRSFCSDPGYELRIRGLYGGHSGEDINKNRRNAIETALSILEKIGDVRIFSIDGGSKDNAIARECTVRFTSKSKSVKEVIDAEVTAITPTLCREDTEFSVTVETLGLTEAFDMDFTARLLALAEEIPTGVIRMNPDIDGLVHTSANLGVIRTTEEWVELTVASRSSDESEIDSQIAKANAAAAKAGGIASHRGRYPGWDFEKESSLRELYLRTYDDLFGDFGKKARFEGIHAGLECGLVKAAIPDMDIISIGADIRSCHTPDETLNAASLDRLHLTVSEMIRRMAE